MKKSTAILLIVASCLVIIGALLAVAAVAIAPDGIRSIAENVDSYIFSDTYTYSGRYAWENEYAENGEYSAASAYELRVDWVGGAVSVAHYDGDTIKFVETLSSGESVAEEDALCFGTRDNTLYIQYAKNGTHSALPDKMLTIYLPKSAPKSIEINTASADITLQEILCSRIYLDTSSGNIDVLGQFTEITANSISGELHVFHMVEASDDSRAERGEFHSISGEIYILGDYRSVNADSTSGSIHINGTIDHLDTDTISGSVEFEGWVNALDVETTSGDVIFAIRETPYEVSIDAISGNITLLLPESSTFSVEFDTASGNFECDFPVTYKNGQYRCGNGGAEFEIDTTSGDLKIGIN